MPYKPPVQRACCFSFMRLTALAMFSSSISGLRQSVNRLVLSTDFQYNEIITIHKRSKNDEKIPVYRQPHSGKRQRAQSMEENKKTVGKTECFLPFIYDSICGPRRRNRPANGFIAASHR